MPASATEMQLRRCRARERQGQRAELMAEDSSAGSFTMSLWPAELSSEGLQSKTVSSRFEGPSMYRVSLLFNESDFEASDANLNRLAASTILSDTPRDAATDSISDLTSIDQQKNFSFPSWFEQSFNHASTSKDVQFWNQTMGGSDFSHENTAESIHFAEPNVVQCPSFTPPDGFSLWSVLQGTPRKYPGVLMQTEQQGTGKVVAARYVLGILRSFPEMLLESFILPPFIHTQAAIDTRSYNSVDNEPRQLREPMAHCVSLVHMFQGKAVASSAFIWKTIFSEQHTLYNKVSYPGLSTCGPNP
jgi:hypothetical protein